MHNRSFIDRHPFWFLFIGLWITTFFIAMFSIRAAVKNSTWNTAPCSHFVDYKINDMPARCVGEYTK